MTTLTLNTGPLKHEVRQRCGHGCVSSACRIWVLSVVEVNRLNYLSGVDDKCLKRDVAPGLLQHKHPTGSRARRRHPWGRLGDLAVRENVQSSSGAIGLESSQA
jgi:hypothetical protein